MSTKHIVSETRRLIPHAEELAALMLWIAEETGETTQQLRDRLENLLMHEAAEVIFQAILFADPDEISGRLEAPAFELACV